MRVENIEPRDQNFMSDLSIFDKILFFVAGTNKEMLRKGDISIEDEKTLKFFGFFVILSVSLAFSGAYFVAQFLFPKIVSLCIAFVYAGFILTMERRLFENNKMETLQQRVTWICVSSFLLSFASSFYFSEDIVRQKIVENNSEYNKPLDSAFIALKQRHGQEMDNLKNSYNEKINNTQDALNNVQSEPITIQGDNYFESGKITQQQKSRLGELRRTEKDLKSRYNIEYKELQERHRIETDYTMLQSGQKRKNINPNIISKREAFATWVITMLVSPLTLLGLFFSFGIEVMPCIIRFFNRNSVYLKEVGQYQQGKRKDKTVKRNQLPQQENQTPSFEDEY
jgi:hypothetical protein